MNCSEWGAVARERGDHAGARGHFERALAGRVAALGGRHVLGARAEVALAAVCRELGDYRRAEHHGQRALAFYTELLGGDHPEIANTLTDPAQVDEELRALFSVFGD